MNRNLQKKDLDIWGGWLYLLPDLTSQRVLVVAASQAVVQDLQRRCQQLRVIKRFVDVPVLVDTLAKSGRPANTTDVLVLFTRSDQALTGRDLAELKKSVLAPGSSFYIQTSNPFSKASNGQRSTVSLFRYWRWLVSSRLSVKCGEAETPCWRTTAAVALHRKRPISFQVSQRYYPLQNAFLLREKIKRWLFWSPLAGVFSDGWACSSATASMPVYQQVAQNAAQRAGFEDPVITHFLILNQKAILLVTPRVGDHRAGVVAVICNTDYLFQRREQELQLLAELRRTNEALRPYLPEPFGIDQVGGYRVCYQRRVPGITVEIDFPGLSGITLQAQQFLKLLVGRASLEDGTDDHYLRRFAQPLV